MDMNWGGSDLDRSRLSGIGNFMIGWGLDLGFWRYVGTYAAHVLMFVFGVWGLDACSRGFASFFFFFFRVPLAGLVMGSGSGDLDWVLVAEFISKYISPRLGEGVWKLFEV